MLGKTPRFGEIDFKEKSRQSTLKSKPSADRSASAVSRGIYNANLSDSEDEELELKKAQFLKDVKVELSDCSSSDDDQPHSSSKENVFEANEENILDDALYVYDYLTQVIGI